MNPEAASAANAALVEKIRSELGEDWTKLDGIAGSEKAFGVWDDDQVVLTAGRDIALYLIDGDLWARLRKGGSIVTGRFHEGAFEVTAETPDASQN